MSDAKVTFKGIEEVDAVFDKLLSSFSADDLYEISEAGMKVAYDKANDLVPVRTGFLKSTIHIERDGNAAVLVADAPYAEPVEFGTSKMPAQPFIRPALSETDDINRAMAEMVAKKQAEVIR